MQIYYAPLEGITGFLYRNLFEEYFGEGMDKYFTPFLVPTGGGFTKNRSMKDILPENNEGMPIVPQLLSNNAEDFLILAEKLRAFGYREINLNLGCPYRTVVSKGRGSGFLADDRRERLKEFLTQIFEGCQGKIEVSVKTRIGMESLDEWEEILELYNQFPMKELIIHPRLQKEFYTGKPHMDAFDLAVQKSRHSHCYNGDIFTKKDYEIFMQKYPQTDKVMIGRGFLVNPGLLQEIRQGKKMTVEELKSFHDRLYREYRVLMGEDRNAIFKMKELWNYMQYLFVSKNIFEMQGNVHGVEEWNETEKQNRTALKYIKTIRKTAKAAEYEAAVNGLFRECRIREDASFEG